MIDFDKLFIIKDNPDMPDDFPDHFRSIKYNWTYIWSIPEFSVLRNTEQNPKWHPEGNVDIHTKLVCKSAIEVVNQNNYLSGLYNSEKDETRWLPTEKFEEALIFLTAALFHDIGKGNTTKIGKDGNWHSYGHEFTGEKLTRSLLWNTDVIFREKVCSLVKYHMRPSHYLTESKHYVRDIVDISNNIPSWKMLLDLKYCDITSSYMNGFADISNCFEEVLTLNKIENLTKALSMFYGVNKIKYTKPNYSSTVYVMVGLPGSGKNTIIDNMFKTSIIDYCGNTIPMLDKNNTVVLSRDDIRVSLGFCNENDKIVGTPEQENKVSSVFNKQLFDALNNNKDVIINNINLKRKYRNELKNQISHYNVKYTYIYVEADSISKNIERRKGQIDENSFKRMIENFDWPEYAEYNNIFISTN